MTPNEAMHLTETLLEIVPLQNGLDREKIMKKAAELLSYTSPEHGRNACNWVAKNREWFTVKALSDGIAAAAPPRQRPENERYTPIAASKIRAKSFSPEFIERLTVNAEESGSPIQRKMITKIRAENGAPPYTFQTPERERPPWLMPLDPPATRAYRGGGDE